MPGIRLRDGEPIEVAIKKLKKQCEKAGIIADVRKREAYEKPSVRLKKKTIAARKRAIKNARKQA